MSASANRTKAAVLLLGAALLAAACAPERPKEPPRPSTEIADRELVEDLLARNRERLEALTASGEDPAQPRTIGFLFWAAGEGPAGNLAGALERFGWKGAELEVDPANPGLVRITVRRRMSPAEAAEADLTRKLLELAQEAGADYDGWWVD